MSIHFLFLFLNLKRQKHTSWHWFCKVILKPYSTSTFAEDTRVCPGPVGPQSSVITYLYLTGCSVNQQGPSICSHLLCAQVLYRSQAFNAEIISPTRAPVQQGLEHHISDVSRNSFFHSFFFSTSLIMEPRSNPGGTLRLNSPAWSTVLMKNKHALWPVTSLQTLFQLP